MHLVQFFCLKHHLKVTGRTNRFLTNIQKPDSYIQIRTAARGSTATDAWDYISIQIIYLYIYIYTIEVETIEIFSYKNQTYHTPHGGLTSQAKRFDERGGDPYFDIRKMFLRTEMLILFTPAIFYTHLLYPCITLLWHTL